MKKIIVALSASLSSYIIAQTEGDNLFNTPVIHTVKIFFTQPNWYDSLIYYKPLDIKMKGDVEIDGTYIPNVGIQFKGNSSFNNPSQKKSWKIDFNEFVSGQKYDGLKVINLNNGFKDPTFLREKLALDFCNRNGIPAPRCTYANVYVNNQLWGFYMLVEQVNTTFLKRWFNENNGNLFKGDPQGTLQWYGSNPSSYYTKYELKTNETINDWTDLVHLIDIINNKPSSQFYDSLESIMTTSLTIKSWAFNILFANLDSYQGSGHNYYIYHDLFYNKFGWITWDVNEAFGNFNQGMSISQLENLDIFYIPSPSNNRPLTYKMLQNNTYKQQYIQELCNFLSGDFDTSYLYHQIDSLVPIIRPYVYADTKKFYTNTDFENNINNNLSTGGNPPFNIPGLKSFILNRRNIVQSQLAANGCLLNINEQLSDNLFAVFPVPADEYFTIYSPDTKSNTNIIVEINDITGKTIYKNSIKSFQNLKITTKNWNSGIYFIFVKTSDNILLDTHKILIAH
ncbi:MAG: hypothetical protein Fur0023_07110 [Bacteroidia bacterium]